MFTKIVKNKIKKYIKNKHDKIQVKSGNGMFNFMCHANATQYAIKHNEKEIILCICINKHGTPFIHFINKNVDGEYIDNTLGFWSKTMEYYLIKNISEDDYFNIEDIFTNYRKYLRKKLGIVLRLLSDFTC